MSFGYGWSEEFVAQFHDKEMRDAYVADQIRTRIALLIRALRDDREWSQTELGRRAGKPQNVISRLEDPDYGRLTLETLLEVAAAFDLPLFIDMPEWEDWFDKVSDSSTRALHRRGFDLNRLTEIASGRNVEQGEIKSEAAAAFANMLVGQQAMSGLYSVVANQNVRQEEPKSRVTGAALMAAAGAA